MVQNWFRKKKLPQTDSLASYAEYYLGPETQTKGILRAEQDIVLDGVLKGEVHTPGFLELGKNSRIQAKITARTAAFEGTYGGDARVEEDLMIVSCAQITGSLSCSNLTVEKGAILTAKIAMES